MKISPPAQMIQQVAGGIGLLFSCFLIYSITIALIDEAVVRFVSVAVGFVVALTGHPLAGQIKANQWRWVGWVVDVLRSEEHTSELQSRTNLVCRLLLEKKKK